MTQLDLQGHENPTYNCLDVLLFTIARNWGLDHRLMFVDGWRFRYVKAPASTTTLAFEDACDVRELVENRRVHTALAEYCGLVVNDEEFATLADAMVLIDSELGRGHPVAIRVDAYHCSWSAAYGKYHLEHYCLVIGHDSEKQTLIILDPYLTANVVELPESEYALTLRDALTFDRINIPPTPPDWRPLLARRVDEVRPHLPELRDLADDLVKFMDFHEEVAKHEQDPYASFLVLYFKTLAFSRLNYAECLQCLSERHNEPELAALATRFKHCGDELFKIFLLLMKFSMTPQRFRVENLARRLNDIADREEDLCRHIAQIVVTPKAVDCVPEVR